MAGGCEFVNEEKSGPSRGWVCSLTGKTADHDIASCYCSAEVNCQYCPQRGGDDHIRNPEPLTQEICDAIISSVSGNLNYAMEYIQYAVQTLFQRAGATGYVNLTGKMENAAWCAISAPVCSGEYTSIVLTDEEQKRAEDLESQLNELFLECQPNELVGSVWTAGMLKIGPEDFTCLQEYADTYLYGVQESVNGPVDGTYSKYIVPAQNMQEMLGESLYEYLACIKDSIYAARSEYESGWDTAISSLGSLSAISSGNTPGWRLR